MLNFKNKSMKNFKLNMLFLTKKLYQYDLKMKLILFFLVVSLFKIQATTSSIEGVRNTIPNNDKAVVQQSISGTIISNDGLPLAGATIMVKGTSGGTTTDFDGNYTISAANDAVLIFSYIGFITQEVSINGRSLINITMVEDASQLEEVLLIGYGKQRAKDITGSVKLITAEDFNGGVTNSPGQLIQGKIAGVNVTANTGEPGSAISINIRGVNSIGTGSDPLFVVDGIPLDGGDSPSSGLGELTATRQSPLNFLNFFSYNKTSHIKIVNGHV